MYSRRIASDWFLGVSCTCRFVRATTSCGERITKFPDGTRSREGEYLERLQEPARPS